MTPAQALLCVDRLDARIARSIAGAPAKHARLRRRLARFARLHSLLGRRACLIAVLDAFTQAGRTLTTAGPFALGDHSSGMIARMVREHGYGAAETRALRPRLAAFPAMAKELAAVIDAAEQRTSALEPAERVRYRFALTLFMAEHLACRSSDAFRGVRAVLVVDDLDARRMGVATAALACGRKVGCVVMTGGARPAPPFALHAAFCVEASQLETFQAERRAVMPLSRAAPPAPVAEGARYRVGLAFNAETDETLIRAAYAALTAHPRSASVTTRLHPGFRPEAAVEDCGVTTGLTLAEFVRTCDVLVCGNSGALLDGVLLGRPVVYSDALDHTAHDQHGFVARGLVHEHRGPLEAIDFDAACAFYLPQRYDRVFAESFGATSAAARLVTPAEILTNLAR